LDAFVNVDPFVVIDNLDLTIGTKPARRQSPYLFSPAIAMNFPMVSSPDIPPVQMTSPGD